ncbi:radical SAM protein [Candidatus Woesearchaeota archaeon]|nr:radical SAM protein [Candidatus Woesearchaeota archaeon]
MTKDSKAQDNKPKENQYYSYNLKQLPKGCQYCVRGEKLVLFVTGICPRSCVFCPVSDEKYQKDVTFANERSVKSDEDLIKEAELMRAKGAGITGGDPLTKLDRTLEYIKLLKQKFGSHFHIHLYTSLNLVTAETLSQLFQAGLDEIRFHLELDDKKLWSKLILAKEHSWDVGVEIPLMPSKEREIKELIDFIQDKVKFLNLNELETADNSQYLLEKNTKDELSYAIQDSLEVGLKIINYVQEKNYSLAVHLCTAKLKDKVQLGSRIKRQAKGAKKVFDIIDNEGMLNRGAIYLPELFPGFNYRDRLKTIDKAPYIQKLKPLKEKIQKELHLRDDQIFLDEEKPRILLSVKMLRKNLQLYDKLGLRAALVLEYPTADQLEVEVDFLL